MNLYEVTHKKKRSIEKKTWKLLYSFTRCISKNEILIKWNNNLLQQNLFNTQYNYYIVKSSVGNKMRRNVRFFPYTKFRRKKSKPFSVRLNFQLGHWPIVHSVCCRALCDIKMISAANCKCLFNCDVHKFKSLLLIIIHVDENKDLSKNTIAIRFFKHSPQSLLSSCCHFKTLEKHKIKSIFFCCVLRLRFFALN